MIDKSLHRDKLNLMSLDNERLAGMILNLESERTALRSQVAELQRQLDLEMGKVRPVDPADDSYPNAKDVAATLRNCREDLLTEARYVLWLASQLDEQTKQKPVGYYDVYDCSHKNEKPSYVQVKEQYKDDGTIPLYALPPNIAAMIERAVREEREAALKPLRTAVLALAHALERDPGYRSAYEEVDAAIRARGEKK